MLQGHLGSELIHHATTLTCSSSDSVLLQYQEMLKPPTPAVFGSMALTHGYYVRHLLIGLEQEKYCTWGSDQQQMGKRSNEDDHSRANGPARDAFRFIQHDQQVDTRCDTLRMDSQQVCLSYQVPKAPSTVLMQTLFGMHLLKEITKKFLGYWHKQKS